MTISASSTNVSCNGDANGTITASSSTGSTITVNGNPYVASATYSPGTYTIVASAPNGNNNGSCTATTSVTITQPIKVTVSASATNVSCNGAANGTITASSSAGSTITVNGNPYVASATYGPGTYTVVASAPNGNNNGSCTATISVTISQPAVVPPPTLSVANNCGSSNVTASGIIGTLSWSDGGAGNTRTFTNVQTLTAKQTLGVCISAISNSVTTAPKAIPLANGTNSNVQLYYGYSGDQTSIIKVTPTGGVAPYKVVFTMNRPLKCNYINDAGDEVWTPGLGTSTNANISCPANPQLATLAPVSTANSIPAGSSYQVTLTLMDSASITATITDAAGCQTIYKTKLYAEDVRCFAGNSNNVKVNICHQTGSTKNPCVKICVDQSAVAEHLSHGDFLGNCTPDCKAPIVYTRMITEEAKPLIPEVTLKLYPNPTSGLANLFFTATKEAKYSIIVTDFTGKQLQRKELVAIMGENKVALNLSKNGNGIYMVQLIGEGGVKSIKVVRLN